MDLETITCHGYVINLEKHIETIPLNTFGSFSGAAYGRTSIDMSLRFHDHSGIQRPFGDLKAGRAAKAEEEFRKNNPTVQQAWEEYQLLLKLS